MTGIAIEHGAAVVLVCDSCGWSTGRLNMALDGWPTLWRLAGQWGWRGASSPVGPHSCLACACDPGPGEAAESRPPPRIGDTAAGRRPRTGPAGHRQPG
jgi:hypothetical protein